MKTLSDKHLEHLQRLVEEKNMKKKEDFLGKIKVMLEKYNCTSMKDLNDEMSINFIQEMINEPEVTALNEDDQEDDLAYKEYLEHAILSSANPEKVAEAEKLLASLEDKSTNLDDNFNEDEADDNAESMQNGSSFSILKNGENIEVIQKSFDKETGVFTGEDFKGEIIEYTADDVIDETNETLEISKETALKIFEYNKLSGELPEEISQEVFNSLMKKYDIK